METIAIRSKSEIELENLLDNFQDIRSGLYYKEKDSIKNGINIKIKPSNIVLFLLGIKIALCFIIKNSADIRNINKSILLFNDETYFFNLKFNERVIVTGNRTNGIDEIKLVTHSFWLNFIIYRQTIWLSMLILSFFGSVNFDLILKSKEGNFRKESEMKSGFYNISLYLEDRFNLAKKELEMTTSLLRYTPEYNTVSGLIFYSKDFRWHCSELWETKDVAEILIILHYSYKALFKDKYMGLKEVKPLWKKEYNKTLVQFYQHKELLDKGVF